MDFIGSIFFWFFATDKDERMKFYLKMYESHILRTGAGDNCRVRDKVLFEERLERMIYLEHLVLKTSVPGPHRPRVFNNYQPGNHPPTPYFYPYIYKKIH